MGEDLALCLNCKMEVNGENIIREKIDDGETVRTAMTSMKNMDVNTTMFSCPNCKAVLGFAQYLSFSTTPQKREISFL
jgi:hypothetical protein